MSWQHTREQQQQQQQGRTDYYLFTFCLGAFKLHSPLPLHGSHYQPPKGRKQQSDPKTTPSCQGASLCAAAAALHQRIASQLAPFKRLLQAIRRPNQQKPGLCVCGEKPGRGGVCWGRLYDNH